MVLTEVVDGSITEWNVEILECGLPLDKARGGWAAYTFKKERTGLKVNTGLKP